MELQPIFQKEAFEFVRLHHRTHKAPQGWLFGIAANDGGRVIGVITIGRPVARNLQDGWTCEITRCCVMDNLPPIVDSRGVSHSPSVASYLYGAAVRASLAMGYKRIITYTLIEEPGTSLRAAGWKFIHTTSGGSWNCESRPRVDNHPTSQKTLWEIRA